MESMGDSEKLKMLVSEQVKRVLQTGEPKEQPPKNTRGKASATQKAKNAKPSSEKANDKANDRAVELAVERANNKAERAQLEEREKAAKKAEEKNRLKERELADLRRDIQNVLMRSTRRRLRYSSSGRLPRTSPKQEDLALAAESGHNSKEDLQGIHGAHKEMLEGDIR